MGSIIMLVVIGTSIWVLIDAKSIGVKKGQIEGIANMGPWGWFVACLLLWIIGFPLYLVKRREFMSDRPASSSNSRTTKCPRCNLPIDNENECEHCGLKFTGRTRPTIQKKNTGVLTYILAGIGAVVLIGFIYSLMTNYSTTQSSKPNAGFKMPSIGKQIVTFNEYKRIQDGMSYRKVVAIIGAEGEELSRNKMEGVEGVMESVETVMFQWRNKNGSNMNAMFQNDKLIQKAQFGLK